MTFPDPFEKPETFAEDPEDTQVKVAPVTSEVSTILVMSDEQMVCARGEVVSAGPGLMVITTLDGVPEQPLADGVTMYVAVSVLLLVE